jgi:hypothetical protein
LEGALSDIRTDALPNEVFVAEAPDLNLSTTGNSVGAAFLLLKEQIITTYGGISYQKRTGHGESGAACGEQIATALVLNESAP